MDDTKTNKTSNFVFSQTMRLSITGYPVTVPGLCGVSLTSICWIHSNLTGTEGSNEAAAEKSSPREPIS